MSSPASMSFLNAAAPTRLICGMSRCQMLVANPSGNGNGSGSIVGMVGIIGIEGIVVLAGVKD